MFGTEEIYYFKASEKPRLNRQVEDQSFADRVGEVEAYLAENADLLKVREPPSPPAVSVTAAAPAAPSQPTAVSGTDRMIDVDFFGMDLSPTGIAMSALKPAMRSAGKTRLARLGATSLKPAGVGQNLGSRTSPWHPEP